MKLNYNNFENIEKYNLNLNKSNITTGKYIVPGGGGKGPITKGDGRATTTTYSPKV